MNEEAPLLNLPSLTLRGVMISTNRNLFLISRNHASPPPARTAHGTDKVDTDGLRRLQNAATYLKFPSRCRRHLFAFRSQRLYLVGGVKHNLVVQLLEDVTAGLAQTRSQQSRGPSALPLKPTGAICLMISWGASPCWWRARPTDGNRRDHGYR